MDGTRSALPARPAQPTSSRTASTTPASLDVPIVEFEDNAEFTESDTELFGRPAGPIAKTISSSVELPHHALYGSFVTENCQITWEACGNISIRTRSGRSAYYDIERSDSFSPSFFWPVINYGGGSGGLVYNPIALTITRVVFVPLESLGRNIFRVDVYKQRIFDDVSIPADIFSSEGLAVQILMTEESIGNVYFETTCRMLQSRDEMSLTDHCRMHNYNPQFTFALRPGATYYPSGTVADAVLTGLIDRHGDPNDAVDITIVRPETPAKFNLTGTDTPVRGTTTGLVVHTRIPLNFLAMSAVVVVPAAPSVPSATTTTNEPLLWCLLVLVMLVFVSWNLAVIVRARK